VYEKPKTPEEKQTRYFRFCRLRNERYSAEDIAARLLGPDSSPTVLYRELGKEGFPVCQWCGAYSADKSFCAEHRQEIEQKRNQGAAHLSGQAIKLPPAIEAKDLFREAIAELSSLIDPLKVLSENQNDWETLLENAYKARRTLDWLEEYRQGEHIVSYSVEDSSYAPVIYKKDFTDEEWEEVCAEQGVESPTVERIILEDMSAIPYGARKAPAEILVKLIGAYLLADKPLEPLVEKLHQTPGTVDWEKIEGDLHGYATKTRNHIPGMLDKLRSIATEVRGGIRRTGPFKELSDKDMEIASKINQMQRLGFTRGEIYEELKNKGYTRSDVDRLTKAQPERPSWELPD
jgi:hypothetical protein